MTIGEETRFSATKLEKDSINSVCSSSLGSVNIENFYSYKRETAFKKLQRNLLEKGLENEIIRDILKLLRSYSDFEFCNRNWVKYLKN